MSNNLFSTIRAVRLSADNPEPNLDLEKMDLEKYKTTRDESLIVLRENTTADFFSVKRISLIELQYIKKLPITEGTFLEYFRLGCQQIEMSDGQVLVPKEFKTISFQGVEFKEPTQSWLDEVNDYFGYNALIEMGVVARDMAMLPKGQKKGFASLLGMIQKPLTK